MTNYRRALLRVIRRAYGAITVTRRISPVSVAGCCVIPESAQASRCVLSLSLSLLPTYFVKAGRVDNPPPPNAYPVIFSHILLLSPFRFQKENASDYTGSDGCALTCIFPYVTYVRSTRTTDSIIGCSDNPCYHNVLPTRNSNVAASLFSVFGQPTVKYYQLSQFNKKCLFFGTTISIIK